MKNYEDASSHPISQKDLYNMTTECVHKVLASMADTKKRLVDITAEQIAAEACSYMAGLIDSLPAAGDKRLAQTVSKSVTDYVWQLVNLHEARYIISKLKTDKIFCENFFYGTHRGAGPDMVVILKKILYEVNSTYHLSLDQRDICTMAYTKIWDNGEWGVLDGFGYRSSIFSWLDTVAHREVIKRLEEEHYIKVNREKTAGNTRLAMKSCDPDYCRLVIDDNVYDVADRRILQLVYVDGLQAADAMRAMGMEQDVFENSLKKAESRLRDAMVRSNQEYDDILSDKDPRDISVSIDDASYQLKDLSETNQAGMLAECLGMDLGPEQVDIDAIAQKSIMEIEARMAWNDLDREIWRAKFWEPIATKEISAKTGRSVGYIDNRYKQIREQFGREARVWAVQRGYITDRERRQIEDRIKRIREEHRQELARRRAEGAGS